MGSTSFSTPTTLTTVPGTDDPDQDRAVLTVETSTGRDARTVDQHHDVLTAQASTDRGTRTDDHNHNDAAAGHPPGAAPVAPFDAAHPPPPTRRPGTGIEPTHPFDPAAFEAAVQALLRACGVGEDELRAGHMKSTAKRVQDLWSNRLLGGYRTPLPEVLGAGFDDPRQDLVTVRGIAVHGVCPHHLVPFRGVAHVAYLPGGRLHGFGRIARLVDAICHRFTYQEWLTRDIAEALMTHGQARGAAVVVSCEQLCLLLGENRRGEERVVTQCVVGALETDPALRAEALRAVAAQRYREP
jgi:GTP cyclohydrolase IA